MVNYNSKFLKYKLKYEKLLQKGSGCKGSKCKVINANTLAPPLTPSPHNTLVTHDAEFDDVTFDDLNFDVQLPKRYVYLDIDETLGFFGLAEVMYQAFRHYEGRDPPEGYINYIFNHGVVRPHLKEFLKTLYKWKTQRKIHEVGLWTSASNSSGWVTFNKKCFEKYTDTNGLFDKVITREIALKAGCVERDNRIIKNLELVSSDGDNVILVDDKPEYALNGLRCHVEEYRQELSEENFQRLMRSLEVRYSGFVADVLISDRINNPPSQPQNQSTDSTLLNVLKAIAKQFEIQM